MDKRSQATPPADPPTGSPASPLMDSPASPSAGELDSRIPRHRDVREPGRPESRFPSRPVSPDAGARAVQSSLELTLAEAPPEPTPRTPVRRADPAASAAARATPQDGPSSDLTALVSEFRERIAAVAATTTTQAVAAVTSGLEAQLASINTRLDASATEATGIVRLMEEVLDAAVGVAEQTARQGREGHAATMEKLEQLIVRTERLFAEMNNRGEAQSKRIGQTAQDLLTEARKEGQRLGWRPWIMSGTMAVFLILLVTLLRPGWTMSSDQRRALRVGESVIHTYSTAREPARAEMRRVMRWRSPEHPETTEAPLVDPPK